MNTITSCNECKCVNDAAKSGHLECLKYHHEKGRPWDEWACIFAANNGHIECLQYLHKNGFPWDKDACAFAAKNGQLECLEYLHKNGCPWDTGACGDAAANGHLEILKYLHENGCPWNQGVCAHAAKNGQLECLEYLHKNGCPWDKRVCAFAAANGHLDCLEYLYENGCLWDERACACAANNGHIECLKYLHEKGCPWNEFVCELAAKNGHIEILKYLYENGCPWNEWACRLAAENGHIDCLEYLHRHGCPCIHTRSKLKIYPTEFDIQAEKEDPDSTFGAAEGGGHFVATKCSICFTNRNKVQFKPCNHTLCIGCSNAIITKNNAENKNTTCPFCRANVEENLLLPSATMNTVPFCNECEGVDDAAKSGHLKCLKYFDENTECSICYIINRKVQLKPCNHMLCIECYKRIFTRHYSTVVCPFCR